MPFHFTEPEVKRLSIDIDLLTSKTMDEVRYAMSSINDSMTDIRCAEHKPIDPYPVDNLISYKAYYNSCLGRNTFVKVDFLCNVNIRLNSQLMKSGFRLFGFDTNQDMDILSKGSLLGDKLTTLALGTVGLKPSRQTEVAKQIYDLGMLLRRATKPDLQVAFDTFENMTGFKVSHFDHDPEYTVSDISRSIAESVLGFLNLKSAVSITNEQEKRYHDFQGTYLAKKTRYKKTEHVTDILLIKLYSRHLCRYLNGESTQAGAIDSLYGVLEQVNKIKRGQIRDVPQMEALYKQGISDAAGFKKKILNGASLEHLFLMYKLYPTRN